MSREGLTEVREIEHVQSSSETSETSSNPNQQRIILSTTSVSKNQNPCSSTTCTNNSKDESSSSSLIHGHNFASSSSSSSSGDKEKMTVDEKHCVVATSTGPSSSTSSSSKGHQQQHQHHRGGEEEGEGQHSEENDSDPPVENYHHHHLFNTSNNNEEDLEEEEEEDHEGHEHCHHHHHNSSSGGGGGGTINVHNNNSGNNSNITAEEQRQQHQNHLRKHPHRKRKKSTGGGGGGGGNGPAYVPPYKKRYCHRQRSVLPSKFLLGGNIRDPLNLASLDDEKVNAALNAETPKSSPMPIPPHRHGVIPVFIPRNPDDPLGLQCGDTADDPSEFIAGIRKNRQNRKRHHRRKGRKRTDSECSVDKSEDQDSDGMSSNKQQQVPSNNQYGRQQQQQQQQRASDEEENSTINTTSSIKLPICSSDNKESAVTTTSTSTSSTSLSNSNRVQEEKEHQSQELASSSSSLSSTSNNIKVVDRKLSTENKVVDAENSSGSGTIPRKTVNAASLQKQDNSSSFSSEAVASGSGISTTTNETSINTTTEEQNSVTTVSQLANIDATGSDEVSTTTTTTAATNNAANTAATTTAAKKHSRARKRKHEGNHSGSHNSNNNRTLYSTAPPSDYIPMGTPSASEPVFFDGGFTPSHGGDVPSLPFESPLINYINTIDSSTSTNTITEPFSPPPKTEQIPRRTVPAATTTSSSSTFAIQPSSANNHNSSNNNNSAVITTTLPSTTTTTSNNYPLKDGIDSTSSLQKPTSFITPLSNAAATSSSTDPKNLNRVHAGPGIGGGGGSRKRFRTKSDPIVSPVVPQPGCGRRLHYHHHGYHHHPHHNNYHHHHHHHNHGYHHHHNNKRVTFSTNVIQEGGGGAGDDSSSTLNNQLAASHQKEGESKAVAGPNFRKKDECFQYGNYNRYYGYRTQEAGYDSRLKAFPKDFFSAKKVLDVGCNIGHVTLLIARDFGAEKVDGIDIDSRLIDIARKNVKHYANSEFRDPENPNIVFPNCMPKMFGPLHEPRGLPGDSRKIPFPYNVRFRQENYVLESDDLLANVTPEYDVILCLSITKWIHLNNGDDGLKRFFRRAFLNLKVGGKLVVEPQPWSSYKKKKKLTERIFSNFKLIRFYPDKFSDYLLKDVGFTAMEKLATPAHHLKGFQRPLMIFTKTKDK